MEIIIDSEDQLEEVVKSFLEISNGIKVVFLHGDLGAGKTTFVKRLARILGSVDEVSSPTYSLVNEYHISSGKLYHIDLYRLNDTNEAHDIGIEEYLDSGEYCIIEWPIIVEHLVDQAVVVQIETIAKTSRKFKIEMLNPQIFQH